MSIRLGLCSITFRSLSAIEIIALVQRAGQDGIEWGGDVHVPHGDIETAHRVGELTRAASLQVSSYGSYYRAGVSEEDGLPFQSVLDTAHALGTSSVRVWAGNQGSPAADADYRAKVVEDLKRIGDMAGARGGDVSCEFHGGTLTDSNEAALELMAAVDHPAVRLYWQPPNGRDETYALEGLKSILPYLTNLHVFHWVWCDGQRDMLPLAEGKNAWSQYLNVAHCEQTRWALLEFVRDGSAQQYLADAATLNGWREGPQGVKMGTGDVGRR